MSVRDCLDKLQKTGKITRIQADAADALWRRYQNKFSLDMPAAKADAAAALQAARMMMQTAREKKNSVALQVQRQTSAEQSAMAHPFGPAAGGMAVLTRDIYRTGTMNVDGRVEWARRVMFAKFDAALEAFGSKAAGLKKDTVGAWNMIGELFGVDSGNDTAKLAAKGWKDASEWGAKTVQSAGKIFEENENWRLPQSWTSDRVRRFGDGAEFKRDVSNAVQSGGLKIFDKEREEIATNRARIAELIDKATRDIITEGGNSDAFSKEMRTFQFQDGRNGFDAFKALQEKYGAGTDIMSVLSGHLGAMAREIGLVDVLGPQHAVTAQLLAKNARQWEAAGKKGQGKVRVARMLFQESSSAIDRTYAVQSGRANGVENAAWGGFLGTMRSLMSASSLGSAIIPATIGDSVTMALAARANGMDAVKVIAHAVQNMLGETKQDKEAAAHLLVSSHAMSDHAIGAMRYSEQTGTPEIARKMSDFVLRLSGMNAWTEGAKKAFTMDFLNHIAVNVGKSMDQLEKPLRVFLDRNKISSAEWDALRARPLFDFHGAKYFDSSTATSDPIARKLFEGILDERAFGVLEPDSRVRGLTTAGMKGGTIAGEIARLGTMFQSFSMTMVMTHLHAIAVRDDTAASKAVNYGLFFLAHAIAGAAIVQARQILQGKDPIDMHSPKFWWQSATQGGGLGFYGDLIGGTVSAADRSWVGKFSGPIGGMADDAARFGSAVAQRKPGAIGQGIELAKHIIPGSNLWFSRLATDRLIFDQIHRAVDPTYSQSFARREQAAQKQYGQGYWWHQGQVTPDRAPSLGAGFGVQ